MLLTRHLVSSTRLLRLSRLSRLSLPAQGCLLFFTTVALFLRFDIVAFRRSPFIPPRPRLPSEFVRYSHVAEICHRSDDPFSVASQTSYPVTCLCRFVVALRPISPSLDTWRNFLLDFRTLLPSLSRSSTASALICLSPFRPRPSYYVYTSSHPFIVNCLRLGLSVRDFAISGCRSRRDSSRSRVNLGRSIDRSKRRRLRR